jgi:predicted nucleic acid-binding protein
LRLFLDTSVLLAAADSAHGASRFLVTEAAGLGWQLLSSDYCAEETRRNLSKLGRSAATTWRKEITLRVRLVQTRLSLDRPLVFAQAKDRPIIITALAARAEWLLTLYEADFHGKPGRVVYGLRLATPGEFLVEQRTHGVL